MPLWLFSLLFSALYCCVVITIEFSDVPIEGNFGITAFKWLTVSFCALGPLILICLNRWVFAIGAPILAVVSAAICYYIISLGTRLTGTTFELAMVNDFSVWLTLINTKLVLFAAVALILSALLVYFRWNYVRVTALQGDLLFVLSFFIISLPMALVPRIHWASAHRLPYSIYSSFQEYYENRIPCLEERHTYDDFICTPDENAPNVYLIIGESLRADHIPMNGYERNTMPRLSQDSVIVSFPNIYTEYTETHLSVPHMLTRPDSANPNYAFEDESFIPLFEKAGYRTAWIENQGLSDTYSYFAHECDTLIYVNGNRTLHSYEKWLDSDILPEFKKWIELNGSAPRMAILHTIGSHWWYPSHHTDKHAIFKPEAQHKDIGGLTQEQIINSYDNSIISTDEFLANLIDNVAKEDSPSVIIYLSDHGEGLGEDGLYLHGADGEVLHYPAMFVWYSHKYEELFPEVVTRIKSAKNNKANTTQLFETILDISRLQTPINVLQRSIIK